MVPPRILIPCCGTVSRACRLTRLSMDNTTQRIPSLHYGTTSGGVLGIFLRGFGPIFNFEIGHLHEVTTVTGHDRKRMDQCDGRNAKVLAADKQAMFLEPPKFGIDIL